LRDSTSIALRIMTDSPGVKPRKNQPYARYDDRPSVAELMRRTG